MNERHLHPLALWCVAAMSRANPRAPSWFYRKALKRARRAFVSVTQSFNTTNSMGRLTLNVLLSFAQFEREVTGERIRDKVAASKQKGIWVGGVVPLGYRIENQKLLVIWS
jgi:DNA invertase Pin-like site-specific DNA recombinase